MFKWNILISCSNTVKHWSTKCVVLSKALWSSSGDGRVRHLRPYCGPIYHFYSSYLKPVLMGKMAPTLWNFDGQNKSHICSYFLSLFWNEASLSQFYPLAYFHLSFAFYKLITNSDMLVGSLASPRLTFVCF